MAQMMATSKGCVLSPSMENGKSAVFSCEPKSALRPPCAPPLYSASSLSSGRLKLFRGGRQLNKFPATSLSPVLAVRARIGFWKAQRWWERGLQPNMKDVTDTQDLVDSLLMAGDKLVVVNFFSPGCGACKTLHPKICQLAEMKPDIQFLLVNSEEHKSMCYTLRVHVLPFFRFYKGACGRICSFSCTTATIKKFKDALAKYNVDCCSIGPTRGLEEEELLALAANKDLSFSYTTKAQPPLAVPVPGEISVVGVEAPLPSNSGLPQLPRPLSSTVSADAVQKNQKGSLVSSGT